MMETLLQRDLSGPRRQLKLAALSGAAAITVVGFGTSAWMHGARPVGATLCIAGILLAMKARNALNVGMQAYGVHRREQRALKLLRAQLDPAWRCQATFVAGAPAAILTHEAPFRFVVVIQVNTKVQIKAGLLGFGQKRLHFLDSHIATMTSATLMAQNASLTLNAAPILWYPNSASGAAVVQGDVPIAVGRPKALLNFIGARKRGILS